MHSDLYYFAYAILKAGMMTCVLPGVVIGCCYEIFFGRHWAKVIPFPRKPKGPWPGERAQDGRKVA